VESREAGRNRGKRIPTNSSAVGATPAGTIDILEDNAMANTYVQCLMHVVFSTKERRQIIPRESQSRLWAYMGGVCKKEGVFVREIGGMPDHVHLLVILRRSRRIPTDSNATSRQILAGRDSSLLSE